MDIKKLIELQNKAYIYALNKKLGGVLPQDILKGYLAKSSDPHKIAKLIIETKKELSKGENAIGSDSMKSEGSQFSIFIKWIKRIKS